MRSPEEIIAQAIRFDNRPTSNARRVLEALRDEGYAVVPSQLGDSTWAAEVHSLAQWADKQAIDMGMDGFVPALRDGPGGDRAPKTGGTF